MAPVDPALVWPILINEPHAVCTAIGCIFCYALTIRSELPPPPTLAPSRHVHPRRVASASFSSPDFTADRTLEETKGHFIFCSVLTTFPTTSPLPPPPPRLSYFSFPERTYGGSPTRLQIRMMGFTVHLLYINTIHDDAAGNKRHHEPALGGDPTAGNSETDGGVPRAQHHRSERGAMVGHQGCLRP